nr:E3 ubiquitin-protein ligase ORTHRUS 2 [Ipomoea batatas]
MVQNSTQSFMKQRNYIGALKHVMKCPSCKTDISDFLQNPQADDEPIDDSDTEDSCDPFLSDDDDEVRAARKFGTQQAEEDIDGAGNSPNDEDIHGAKNTDNEEGFQTGEEEDTHRELIADTEKRKWVRASIEMLAFIHHLKITASSPARLQESLLP